MKPVNLLKFTLIELLVVIAIIAILAAMLLPALTKAKDKGKQASCKGNLKQLSLGIQMYTDENDEYYPRCLAAPTSGLSKGPVTNHASTFGTFRNNMDFIYPYVGNREVFDCPASIVNSNWSGHYGINRNIAPDARTSVNAGVFMGDVDQKSETVMIADAGAYYTYEGHVSSPQGYFWYVPGTCMGRDPVGGGTYEIQEQYRNDYVIGRHGTGLNITFCDGHTEWMSGAAVRAKPSIYLLK